MQTRTTVILFAATVALAASFAAGVLVAQGGLLAHSKVHSALEEARLDGKPASAGRVRPIPLREATVNDASGARIGASGEAPDAPVKMIPARADADPAIDKAAPSYARGSVPVGMAEARSAEIGAPSPAALAAGMPAAASAAAPIRNAAAEAVGQPNIVSEPEAATTMSRREGHHASARRPRQRYYYVRRYRRAPANPFAIIVGSLFR